MRKSKPVLVALVALATVALAPPPAPAQDHTCVVMVTMTSGTEVNNLDFSVNYSDLDGEIEGLGQNPTCRVVLANSFVAYNDDDAAKRMGVGIIRLAKFSAPRDLFACRVFYDTMLPVPGEFRFTVSNATRDGEDEQISPKPQIAVTSIDCPGQLPDSPTTTTTSTTSTTTTSTTTTTTIGNGRCGFPATDGENPSAADALSALKAAVGILTCPLCVCDVDGGGSVGASDALAILRAAVGLGVNLNCPACV
jgi:hypothetical protein